VPVRELRNREPERYPIAVRMPPDFFEVNHVELRQYWELGAGELDFDLLRPLSSNNATRSCQTCGDTADYYLFKDGITSEFRCVEHLEEVREEL